MTSLLSWRYRIIHFLLLGLLAYLGVNYYSASMVAPPACISELEKASRIDAWQRQFRRPLDAAGRRNVLQSIRDEQLIVREATASRLYESDAVVTRRLLLDADILGITGSDKQKLSVTRSLDLMETDQLIAARLFQLQRVKVMDGFTVEKVSEAQLRQRYEQHKDQHFHPRRLSFSHLFFSSDSAEALRRAEAARAVLVAGQEVADDDHFIHGRAFNLSTISKIKAMFGDQVAAFLSAEQTLNSWSQPISSPYGVHLLNVTAQYPAKSLSYVEMLATLKAQFEEEQRQQYWRTYTASVRKMDELECVSDG
ncbi:MAG: peptidyl-prolyl cis-trans isomerase [Spongiibacteraceae bacterium]